MKHMDANPLDMPSLDMPEQDILSTAPTTDGFYRTYGKQALDRAFAALGVIALLPVLIIIAVAIKIDSRGPVLFRQDRFGLNRAPVSVTKFRTMRTDMADLGGRVQATRNDPRVTPLGRFLRSTCLDELPQLFDVLAGRLALVGPRPHPLAMEIEGQPAEQCIRNYHLRHMVRPGITGLAQVNGNRGPVTDIAMGQERIDYDIEYISKCSFSLDLRILFATLLVPFRRNVCY